MKYLFATKINGTEHSGIIDMDTNMVVCLCTKANSELLLQALNMPVVSNNEVAVCEIEGCNRDVLSDSTMCPHHFAVSLDSQIEC